MTHLWHSYDYLQLYSVAEECCECCDTECIQSKSSANVRGKQLLVLQIHED